MIRRAMWVLLALAAPLAVAGCGGSSSTSSASSAPSGGSPASPTSASSVAPSPTPASPAPAGTGTLVQFGRTGGFAGLSDSFEVREDGRFTLVRTKPAVQKSGQLTATELADLRRVLAESGFASLPKVQAARGADLFNYQVTYRDSQIMAQDGAIVPQLRPVISMLSGLVARYSG